MYDEFCVAARDSACSITRLARRTVVDKLEMFTSATVLVSLERRCSLVKGMDRVFSRQLPKLSERYDYGLLDCPSTLGMLVINALAACKLLVVPMPREELALKSLGKIMRTIE